MTYNKILIEHLEYTRKITLNRPEKRNSLDEEMIFELTDVFRVSSEDDKIKTVILTGAEGNFCSGLYLEYLQKISRFDILQNKQDSQKFKNLLLSIYSCSKPVIAMVDGYALAGGCGIASACDLIISSNEAKFGYTEVKIGFIPAIVMVFLLKRVTETNAKDMLLTSKLIDGKEAHRIGLVNYVTSRNDLENFTVKLCRDLNNMPMSSLSLTKEMFRNVSSMDFEPALEYAVNLNAITRMTEECKNGVAGFLSKSKNN